MAAAERVDRASTPGSNGSLLPRVKQAGRKKLEAAAVDPVTAQMHKNGSSLVEKSSIYLKNIKKCRPHG